MQIDHPQTVSKSAIAFFSGTSLSRITGMFRDMITAFCFGSHPAIAAFMVAFRFSNLLRRLFGEGQMPAGFVPYFETSRQRDPKRGALFFRDLMQSLSVFLLGLIALIEIILFLWWKYGNLEVSSRELLQLTMLMLPGTLFICLFGITASLLQCEKKFFLSGFAPIAFNLVWITTAFLYKKNTPQEAAFALSLSIILAFAMQWFMTLPGTVLYLRQHISIKEFFKPHLFSSEIRSLVKPILFGMIGVGAVQINTALDALFARISSLEGPAYLWYAIRMEQLPLALFGIALSSALLPPLARAVQENATEKYKGLLSFALHRTFMWIFPCTVAIFVLGAASVNLLYGRGDFSEQATQETLFCLWGYGLGLLPSVIVLLLAPAFYARKDFKIPMLASLYSVIFNILLNAVMVFLLNWGAFSIAVSTSIASFFNAIFLYWHLKAGKFFSLNLLGSFGKVILCSFIAGIITLFIGHFLISDPTWNILLNMPFHFVRAISDQFLQFFVMAGSFALFLASYTWLFANLKKNR